MNFSFGGTYTQTGVFPGLSLIRKPISLRLTRLYSISPYRRHSEAHRTPTPGPFVTKSYPTLSRCLGVGMLGKTWLLDVLYSRSRKRCLCIAGLGRYGGFENDKLRQQRGGWIRSGECSAENRSCSQANPMVRRLRSLGVVAPPDDNPGFQTARSES